MLDVRIDQLPSLSGLTPTSLFLIHIKCSNVAWLTDSFCSHLVSLALHSFKLSSEAFYLAADGKQEHIITYGNLYGTGLNMAQVISLIYWLELSHMIIPNFKEVDIFSPVYPGRMGFWYSI